MSLDPRDSVARDLRTAVLVGRDDEPMSRNEYNMRVQVMWQRVRHAEQLLQSVVSCLEGLHGQRPAPPNQDGLTYYPHWINRGD